MKLLSLWIGALALTLGMSACRKIDLLDLAVPVYSYHAQRNLAYGKKERQQLDIYMPSGAAAPAPVILFFYGGSWQRGAKEDYRFVGESFASRGYVTVIADYRLYPEVRFPEFIDDGARALHWVKQHIAEYGGDVRNLYLAGHSAGAYNAVMLGVDSRYLKSYGMHPREIRGVIGLSGPYDFLPLNQKEVPVLQEKVPLIFAGIPENQSQPTRLKRYPHPAPAFFLATGSEDPLVIPANTLLLTQRFTGSHIQFETRVYDGIDHVGLAQALASAFTQKAPVVQDIEAFIARTRQK